MSARHGIRITTIAALGLLIGFITSVTAQINRADVVGRVYLPPGDRNSPVDILVVATPKDNPPAPFCTRTIRDGFFIFPQLPRGEWTFKAELRGYRQEKEPARATLAANRTHPVEQPFPPTPIELRRSAADWPPKNPQIILVLFREVPSPGSPASGNQTPGQSPHPCDQTPYNPPTALKGKVIQRVNSDERDIQGAEVAVYKFDGKHQELERLGGDQTNEKGEVEFSLPQQQPAKSDEYIIHITKKGYNPFITRLCDFVQSGQKAPLEADPEAQADAEINLSLVNTTEATRRYVFLPRLLQTLPLPGIRTFDAFALLVPGVVPAPEAFVFTGPALTTGIGVPVQFSVNGLPSRTNNFNVDGSDNNEEDVGVRRRGFVSLVPQSIESIQEFQVITALGDARFGRNLGGQLNALSRYGTTAFHGTVYGFITDSRLKAKDFFDLTTEGGPRSFPVDAIIQTRDQNGMIQQRTRSVMLDGRPLNVSNPVEGENPFTRSQAGFVFGGPLSRKGTLFFTSFERPDVHARQESHFAVPTVEDRGVFGVGGTGFESNRTRLTPASLPGNAIFSLFPFPNNPLGPYSRHTYTTVLPADGDGTLFSVKLDQHLNAFGARHTLAGRYNFTDDTSVLPVTGGAIFSSLRPEIRTQNVAFFFNSNFSSNTANTVRFSYGRTSSRFDGVRDPFLSQSSFPEFRDLPFLLNAPLLLNVTIPGIDPTYVSAPNLEGCQSSAPQQSNCPLRFLPGGGLATNADQLTGPLGQVRMAGFSPLGVDVFNFPQTKANNTFQWADTFTHIHGPRILTAGFDIRRTQINSQIERSFRPLAVFNGLRNTARLSDIPMNISQDIFSGATLAAAGVPTGLFHTLRCNPSLTSASIGCNPDPTLGVRFTQFNFFFQDEFQVRPNLRLTFGLRYELNTVPITVGRQLESTFVRGNGVIDQAEEILVSRGFDPTGLRLALFPDVFGRDRNNFAPRIGFAWDPVGDGKTVVRGGYGVYFDQFLGILINQSRNAFPDFAPLNLAMFSRRASNTNTDFFFNPANPLLAQALSLNTPIINPGTLNTLGVNAVDLLTSILVDPSVTGSDFPPTFDLVLPVKNLKSPYSQHYALTLEREFVTNYLFSIGYVGTRGIKLLRVVTPLLGLNNSFISISKVDNLFSFPSFQSVQISPSQQALFQGLGAPSNVAPTVFESSASSSYNSLQIEVRKRYSQGWQLGAAFTYSHAIDDVSDLFDTAGAFTLPQNNLGEGAAEILRQQEMMFELPEGSLVNQFDLSSERTSANFDVRTRLVVHFIWDLPEWRKHWLLRNWQLSGILAAQSGQPFTVNSAIDANRDGNLTDRLNSTEGLIVINRGRTRILRERGVNPLDLIPTDIPDRGPSVSPFFVNGKVGRNTFRGPGIATVDMALVKRFRVRDRHEILFRTEVFNLFNRTHFGIPVRILEAPAFGSSVNTTVPARTIQFALKYSF